MEKNYIFDPESLPQKQVNVLLKLMTKVIGQPVRESLYNTNYVEEYGSLFDDFARRQASGFPKAVVLAVKRMLLADAYRMLNPKWLYMVLGLPLTEEEIATLSMRDRHEMEIPYSEEQEAIRRMPLVEKLELLRSGDAAPEFDEIFAPDDQDFYYEVGYSYDKDELWLQTKDSDQLWKYFSGLSEDSKHWFDTANSTYIDNAYADDDQFEYAHYYLDDASKSELSGLLEMVDYDIDWDNLPDDFNFAELIEGVMPDDFEALRGDFCADYGYAEEQARRKDALEYYWDSVRFKHDGDDTITLPCRKLIEFLQEPYPAEQNVTTLNALKDLELNDEIEMEFAYSESSMQVTEEDMKSFNTYFRKAVSKAVENFDWTQRNIAFHVGLKKILEKYGFTLRWDKTYEYRADDRELKITEINYPEAWCAVEVKLNIGGRIREYKTRVGLDGLVDLIQQADFITENRRRKYDTPRFPVGPITKLEEYAFTKFEEHIRSTGNDPEERPEYAGYYLSELNKTLNDENLCLALFILYRENYLRWKDGQVARPGGILPSKMKNPKVFFDFLKSINPTREHGLYLVIGRGNNEIHPGSRYWSHLSEFPEEEILSDFRSMAPPDFMKAYGLKDALEDYADQKGRIVTRLNFHTQWHFTDGSDVIIHFWFDHDSKEGEEYVKIYPSILGSPRPMGGMFIMTADDPNHSLTKLDHVLKYAFDK